MRALVLGLILMPSLAAANCETARVQVCVLALDDAAPVEAVCATTQCATATAVFDYVAFDGPDFVRVDITGPDSGLMDADLTGFAPGADMTDQPVGVLGPFGYVLNGRPLLSVRPCGADCPGVDAEALME